MGKLKALAGGQSKTNTSCYVQACSRCAGIRSTLQQCIHVIPLQAGSRSITQHWLGAACTT